MTKRLAVLVLAVGALALPAAAHATDLFVQGTTDVRDAGLLDDVITPGFKAAYPQYTLKYIAVGTGQALTNAEAGGGSAVLTHAPTLESQFVAGGFSAEPFGRAIFYSDYVILGPKNDPAGVLSGAAHNSAQAFQLIAAAGAAGKANFVSRGDNSGTNVEEKAIWKLTTGVPLVDSGKLAGEPGTGGTDASWYHKTGNGQAQTVTVTDQCPFPGGNCYEMTDRGTFNRLVSKNAISNLQVVSDKNAASAPGGINLLVNSFHAYAVNPAKVPSADLQGAMAFLNYLTSPGFQAKLKNYPNAAQPAFFADARPTLTLTSTKLPSRVVAGARLKVAGTLAYNLPGATPLTGSVLALQTSHTAAIFQAAAGPPAANILGHNTVNAQSQFAFALPASRSGAVQISFPKTKDLSAATYQIGRISVTAKVTLSKASLKNGKVTLSGKALPSTQRDSAAELVVLARRAGSRHFSKVTAVKAKNHSSRFSIPVTLSSGQWQLLVQYRDHNVVRPGSSATRSVSVP
jgi:tungstate transport system substrate-binding protein